MKYSVKELANRYCAYLSEHNFEVDNSQTQPCDINAYNEYSYHKLLMQFDQLYFDCDSIMLTEEFLKGD